MDLVSATKLPVPPLEEQASIAAFLDRETGKIDALLAKKKELIKLLQERRTALITHAVTKGLDPNATMKDSGVEWLGEIPASWEVVRLRHILSEIEQGWSPEAESREAGTDEWGVLRSGCVNGGVFQESDHKALPTRLDPREELEVKAGDVLMSRASGSPALIGSCAYVGECRPRLMISDELFRLIPTRHRILPEYLALMFGSRTVRTQIERAISGASGLASNIGKATVMDFRVALPPISGQEAIIAFLRSSGRESEDLLASIAGGVAYLRDLRTALISAAVTGKIDVRQEVA